MASNTITPTPMITKVMITKVMITKVTTMKVMITSMALF